MLTTAKASIAEYVNGLWPALKTAGRILHPDDTRNVADLVDDGSGDPVIIIHSPQLAVAAAINVYTVTLSVCSKTEDAALAAVDPLLADLRSVSPVAPTTRLRPNASVMREDGFWRVAVGFTLKLK